MNWTGWLLLFVAACMTGAGLWLGRRYGAAIRDTGIGRRATPRQSVLAFLGDLLVVLGLVVLVIGVMITFF